MVIQQRPAVGEDDLADVAIGPSLAGTDEQVVRRRLIGSRLAPRHEVVCAGGAHARGRIHARAGREKQVVVAVPLEILRHLHVPVPRRRGEGRKILPLREVLRRHVRHAGVHGLRSARVVGGDERLIAPFHGDDVRVAPGNAVLRGAVGVVLVVRSRRHEHRVAGEFFPRVEVVREGNPDPLHASLVLDCAVRHAVPAVALERRAGEDDARIPGVLVLLLLKDDVLPVLPVDPVSGHGVADAVPVL